MRNNYMKLLMNNQSSARAGYQVVNLDGGVAEILIHDVIDQYWGVSAQDIIKELNSLGSKDVVIRINCPGGVVTEGLSIYNAIKRYKGNVVCVVDTLAASMASVIALAGDEVHIIDNGTYMIHNPWGVAWGEAEHFRRYADRMDKDRDRIIDIYAEKTGLSSEELAGFMDYESWFTAAEALNYGFVDKVLAASEDSRDIFDLSAFNNVPAALSKLRPVEVLKPVDDPPDNTNSNLQLKAQARLRLVEEADDLI